MAKPRGLGEEILDSFSDDLPLERAGVLVGGDFGLEEVGFLGEVGYLAHPGEGIGASELLGHVEAVEATVGDVLNVLTEETSIQSENASGHAILGVSNLELDGLQNHGTHFGLELRGPGLGVLFADAVDKVDAKVQMDRLIAHDVLELLADTDHLVLALEGEEHHEAAVEEDPLHDDIEADQVLEEGLKSLSGLGGEPILHDGGGEAHFEGILLIDGIHLVVHVEDLALVQRETLDDILESVCVDCLFEALTKHVLTRLGIRDVLEDREHDIVPDEALGGAEEAEIPHDDLALISGEFVGLPELDITLHRNLIRHPVIGAALGIIVPCPGVLQGHKLVHVDLLAVDQAFLIRVDPLGEVVEGGGLGSGGAAGHGGVLVKVN